MTKPRTLQKHHPLIRELRALGLMIGVELVKDEKLTPATSEAEAIRDGGWPTLSPHTQSGCPALLAFFARGRGF